jgi:hypothetical protein
MTVKMRLISFLWLAGCCGFVILGFLDLLGDGVLTWAHYLWLGVGIEMVVVTGAITIFSSTCSHCGTIRLFHDNFCRRCGNNILLDHTDTLLETLTQDDAEEELLRINNP